MAERQLLFILGMHRSGTSALCAALENCGVDFGTDLLEGMAGVNTHGFWEDAAVVEQNQSILEKLGATWYTPPPLTAVTQWAGSERQEALASMRALLERGFGNGPLQAIKDPRLCITLPLWLEACAAMDLSSSACVIYRAPLEVARSLYQRDGFAVGYGLRLYLDYLRMMEAHLPAGALAVTYDDLLADSTRVMQELSETLPLTVASDADLQDVIHADQRHFAGADAQSLLSVAQAGLPDITALEAEVMQLYPASETMAALVSEIVDRGGRLTAVGQEHERALQTLQQRDSDVEHLSKLHTIALSTIDERDAQIRDFDARLQQTGSHLGEALATLDERDQEATERQQRIELIARQLAEKEQQLEQLREQLHAERSENEARRQRLGHVPVIGGLLQRMLFHETR